MKKLSRTTWPAFIAKGMFVTSIYSLCSCKIESFFLHVLPCLSRSSMWNKFEVLSLLFLSQKKSEIVPCLPKRRENASSVYTELSVYVSFESQNKGYVRALSEYTLWPRSKLVSSEEEKIFPCNFFDAYIITQQQVWTRFTIFERN